LQAEWHSTAQVDVALQHLLALLYARRERYLGLLTNVALQLTIKCSAIIVVLQLSCYMGPRHL
jgi:hypothetical protein